MTQVINTRILKLDPANPDREPIQQAAALIRAGRLVAFPTETVYGLGADAMNEAAVQRIFAAKDRPADNPLIVHVSARAMLDVVASGISSQAEKLIERFWPGPLTLVLARKPEVAPSVSAGLNTVAVRMPGNRIALALIEAAETPLAAPSANSSGSPSPTRAQHVAADLSQKIDLILDGGETDIGIESTVLDMTCNPPAVLRPGWITRDALADSIGVDIRSAAAGRERHSPGTRHRHYTPRARVLLLEVQGGLEAEEVTKEALARGKVGFIGYSAIDFEDAKLRVVKLEDSPASYAHSIYAAMRELDEWGAEVIIVEAIDERDEGAAVMDRLRRAAG
jgi:L-threonylcarbamoyladenylate synthase